MRLCGWPSSCFKETLTKGQSNHWWRGKDNELTILLKFFPSLLFWRHFVVWESNVFKAWGGWSFNCPNLKCKQTTNIIVSSFYLCMRIKLCSKMQLNSSLYYSRSLEHSTQTFFSFKNIVWVSLLKTWPYKKQKHCFRELITFYDLLFKSWRTGE